MIVTPNAFNILHGTRGRRRRRRADYVDCGGWRRALVEAVEWRRAGAGRVGRPGGPA